jgi:hypothetical protein
MPVIQDDLWKNPGHPGMIVVTSHATLQQDGRLFMSYGISKEAVRRIPEIELQAGRVVAAYATDGLYGFLPIRPPRPKEKIIGFGIFQSRIQWEDKSDLGIIQNSMTCLRQFAEENAGVKIRMNFPGIQGGLTVDEVAPLLIPLPPSVTICHQGEVLRTLPDNFIGFKELYLQVEGLLQGGQYNQAVEFLMVHGYDIQSAMDQANAVERCLRERRDARRQAYQTLGNTGFQAGFK